MFTETSTFLIRPSDDGLQFIMQTVSTFVGCSAPSSIKTLPTGAVVWLGRGGFYRFDGEGLVLISEPIDSVISTLTASRLVQACADVDPGSHEYRCWVAADGSVDNDATLAELMEYPAYQKQVASEH